MSHPLRADSLINPIGIYDPAQEAPPSSLPVMSAIMNFEPLVS